MPYKRLDLPQRKCHSCGRSFKPRRYNQQFCRQPCAQAFYHQQRKAILHSTGQVTPRPHKQEKPWGWKTQGGKLVYVAKGDREALQQLVEDQL